MAHYLVTGAAGFIGARTSTMLIEQGHTVVGIDNVNDAYDPRVKHYRLKKLQALKGFSFHQHDISQKSAIDLFKNEKLDGVINLAARAGVRRRTDEGRILPAGSRVDWNRQASCLSATPALPPRCHGGRGRSAPGSYRLLRAVAPSTRGRNLHPSSEQDVVLATRPQG